MQGDSSMWITTGQSAELEEIYLHRSESPGEQALFIWVCCGATTLRLSQREAMRLIAALDEAIEKAEFTSSDAKGVTWRTTIAREPSEKPESA